VKGQACGEPSLLARFRLKEKGKDGAYCGRLDAPAQLHIQYSRPGYKRGAKSGLITSGCTIGGIGRAVARFPELPQLKIHEY
jgi:hypothetical protein